MKRTIMKRPLTSDLRGKWRRRLFWIWIVASGLVATYVGIAGPFASYFTEGQRFVAVAVPALMFFMLATGFGWLVLLVFAHREKRGPYG